MTEDFVISYTVFLLLVALAISSVRTIKLNALEGLEGIAVFFQPILLNCHLSLWRKTKWAEERQHRHSEK